MNITFYLLGNKKYKSIIARVRDTTIDAKFNTKLRINPKNFKNGSVRFNKIKINDAVHKNKVNEENIVLNQIQDQLNALEEKIRKAVLNKKRYENIDANWLKRIAFGEKQSLPISFVEYFDFYLDFKEKSLKASTLKKLRTYKKRIENYQKDEKCVLYINEINKKFSFKYQKWSDDKRYAQNTKIQTLKTVKTVAIHAGENGVDIHPELPYILKGMKYEKTENIHLDFNEIKKLTELVLEDKKLDAAKDWLVISCYTALRISDNLKLKKENIKKINEDYFLQLKQQKTETPVNIYLHNDVVAILKKRNMNFPPAFSQNIGSNEVIYNRLIKDVCRLARINNKVKVKLKNPKTNRYELKEVPKYRAITSHIGRRSFATNYYGLIPTPLLIGQTGHSSEKQFLRYVGKKDAHNSLLLAEKMKNISI